MKKFILTILLNFLIYNIFCQYKYDGAAGYEIIYSKSNCNCLEIKVFEIGKNTPLKAVSIGINNVFIKEKTNDLGALKIIPIPKNFDILASIVGFYGFRSKKIKNELGKVEIFIYLISDKRDLED
jgi:hypothetical protein